MGHPNKTASVGWTGVLYSDAARTCGRALSLMQTTREALMQLGWVTGAQNSGKVQRSEVRTAIAVARQDPQKTGSIAWTTLEKNRHGVPAHAP